MPIRGLSIHTPHFKILINEGQQEYLEKDVREAQSPLSALYMGCLEPISAFAALAALTSSENFGKASI